MQARVSGSGQGARTRGLVDKQIVDKTWITFVLSYLSD